MNNFSIPLIFRQLQEEGCMQEKNIVATQDGFYLAYKSLSDMLAQKGILDFLDSEGKRLACSSFFDDWFLYAVPQGNDYIYSLLKLREQEYDMGKDTPADGDTPGVTVCFISFDCRILLDCLRNPSDINRQNLNAEINRVVARRGQRHHVGLKEYFVNPESEGAYQVAALYVKHIASFAKNGYLPIPEQYRLLLQKSASAGCSAKDARVPRFVASLNEKSDTVVCDNEKIYIKDREHPNEYESAAILATHTGNTSVYSFAAEVEYHARFLIPFARIKIPFIGKSIYESAIRADMTIGDTEFEGPAPFYRLDSPIVKRQYHFHQGKPDLSKYVLNVCEDGEKIAARDVAERKIR